MSIVGEVIRPFWLPGLNEISGVQAKGIGGWICDEEYQVYKPMDASMFVLHISDRELLLEGYAADINRFGMASFETLSSLGRSLMFPKSVAWLLIKTYYAAFFSAHAFLRVLGVSASYLEREHVLAITRVATAYGKMSVKPMMGGLYTLIFDARATELTGRHLGSGGSPHEAFWRIFRDRVHMLSSDVLKTNVDTIGNRQLVSVKLAELAMNLSFASSSGGRWLSIVRNAVNYSQKHSAWYPYAGQKPYYGQLFDKMPEWKADPIDLDLTSHDGQDLRRFQATCNFIIGMLRESVMEMAGRCSTGKSFHTYGSMALLNLSEQPKLSRPRR